MQAPTLDESRVEAIAESLFGFVSGAFVSGAVYLGDALGIYRAMRGQGPVSSESLAARTGLAERYLREWLYCQAAAGLVSYDPSDETFTLSDEAALVLADESTPASAIGMFHDFPGQITAFYRTAEAFRTGGGFDYDSGGDSLAEGVERTFAPWSTTVLLSDAIPALDGVSEKLQAGATVADVGGGAARADIVLATAFPRSTFHVYDNSRHALSRAAENIRAAGVTNVFLHNPDDDPLPREATFDFVMCLDCLHDMTRPDLVARAIRAAMKPDGAWFIVDIECSPDPAENIANPLGPALFGISMTSCLPSSALTSDGLALGTTGLPEPRMRELVTAAGFTQFKRVEGLSHPFNAYYEVRP
jgi:SAM-dependent methyltransferase